MKNIHFDVTHFEGKIFGSHLFDQHFPLIWSCYFGKLKRVKFFFQYFKCDPSASETQLPVFWAAFNGHKDIVLELLKYEKVRVFNDFPYQWACWWGHLDVMEKLYERGDVDFSENNNYALVWACCFGRVDVVRYLLRADKVDPFARNWKALYYATIYGHRDVQEELYNDRRINPQNNREQCFNFAKLQWTFARYDMDRVDSLTTDWSELEIIEDLLQQTTIVPECICYYALCWASRHGHANLVKKMINKIPLPNAQYVNGAYSLYWACINGHLEIVQILTNDFLIDPSSYFDRVLALELNQQHGGVNHEELAKLLKPSE